MKPSKYNIALKTRDTNRYFIFNSRTQAVVELPKPILESVRSGECLGLPKLVAASLLKQGLLVGDESDETLAVMSGVLKRRMHKDIRLVLIPTYHCNLRCPYCYEGQITSTETPELRGWADNVIQFLSAQLEQPNTQGATIGFFGGEPLLAAAECWEVAEKASSLLASKNQLFYCTLTTNGSIVNTAVKQLLKYVNSIQVTLDGVADDHDRWRCYANQKGTYDTILKFIAASNVAKVEKTTIRMHLHDFSDQHIQKCARELYKQLGDCRGVSIYFNCPKHACYQQGMTCSHDEEWSLEVAQAVQKALRIFGEEGWPADRIHHADAMGPRTLRVDVSCAMIGRNAFIIDGHNEISFCPVAVRNPHMLLGHLESSTARFEPIRHELTENWAAPSQCERCRALPVCQSGCYAKAVVNCKDIHAPYCETGRINHLIRKACAIQNDLDVETVELLDNLK
jgi:uncharacterized protein